MGRAERENELKQIEQSLRATEKDLEFYSALNSVVTSPAWEKSGKLLLENYKQNSLSEVLQEKEKNKDGQTKDIEPGIIMIRQRVHNRIMRFAELFDDVEVKMIECSKHLEKLKKDIELSQEE